MLQDILIPCIVLTTTLIACLAGRATSQPAHTSLRTAIAGVLECIGAFALFFALNVILGTTLVFAARAAGLQFVSAYALKDSTLLILSALQGLFFRFYWQSR